MRDRFPFSHSTGHGEKGKRSRDIRAVSYRREGPVGPRRADGLRAGSVRLRAGAVMDWHSTRSREELLILLAGRADLEVDRPARPSAELGTSVPSLSRDARRIRRVALRAGQCAWISPRTAHRVVNRSTATAWYLYVTA